MNAYQAKVTFPRCGFSDEEMEAITTAAQGKHRATWLFTNSLNITQVTLRVLADNLFDAADAARRALRPTDKLIATDPTEIAIISEAEAYRRLLTDETLPDSLRTMADADLA